VGADITPKEIRDNFFLYHRRRDREVAWSDTELGLQWQALEDLLELGQPEFFETVEMGGKPSILVVIGGGAHIVTQEGAEVEVRSVDLRGGTYVEVQSASKDETTLICRFEHDALPAPLTFEIEKWEQRPSVADLRMQLRKLVPRVSS
jgi:hypothetical protein